MKIIAHRGYWKQHENQNTITAFKQALEAGFGIETDVRDHNGKLVIAHDLPDSDSLLADELFALFSKAEKHLQLAINIKADGLQDLIFDLLHAHNIHNYFVFDASIPDTVTYQGKHMKYYSRQSDVEPEPNLLESAQGIWLDAFMETWYTTDHILTHVKNDKEVCIVSPELHDRPHQDIWTLLKSDPLISYKDKLSICTDLPKEAQLFFDSE